MALHPTLDRLLHAKWAMEPSHLDAFIASLLALYAAERSAARVAALEPAAALEPKPKPAPAQVEADGDTATVFLRGPMATRVAPLIDAGVEVTDAEVLAAEIKRHADAGKRRVLIVVDSPGGTVDAPAPIMQAIKYAKERGVQVEARIASGHMAASAAYWAILPSTEIVAEQEADEAQPLVGSVGVYTVLVDISRALAERGIERVLISSGGVKGAGADGVISPALIAEEQRLVDAYAAEFVAAVQTHRGVLVEPDGRLYGAAEALRLGLIDRVERQSVGALDSPKSPAILTGEEHTMQAPAAPKLEAYKSLAQEFPEFAADILAAVGAKTPDELRLELVKRRRDQEVAELQKRCQALEARIAELEAAAQEREAKLAALTNECTELRAAAAAVKSFAAAAPADPGADPQERATVKHSEFRAWDAYKRAEWVLKYGSRSVVMD